MTSTSEWWSSYIDWWRMFAEMGWLAVMLMLPGLAALFVIYVLGSPIILAIDLYDYWRAA